MIASTAMNEWISRLRRSSPDRSLFPKAGFSRPAHATDFSRVGLDPPSHSPVAVLCNQRPAPRRACLRSAVFHPSRDRQGAVFGGKTRPLPHGRGSEKEPLETALALREDALCRGNRRAEFDTMSHFVQQQFQCAEYRQGVELIEIY